MVLGVSPDSVESHQQFKAKYGLPMTLIADVDHAIADIFGLKRMGIARTTFVIDPAGRIAQVFEKVDPSGHGEDVAGALAALKDRR